MALLAAAPTIFETRRQQMFPTLEPAEIERLRRFGECCPYAAGEALATAGEVGHGLTIILSGQVDISQRTTATASTDRSSPTGPAASWASSRSCRAGRLWSTPIARGAGRGAGHPARPAARAAGRRGRAWRAHHARADPAPRRAARDRRRRAGHRRPRRRTATCCGWRASCAATAIRIQTLDPETDPCGRALIERFHVDPAELPIVLCPDGQLLRNPSETELARCIGLVSADRSRPLYDVAIVGAGPGGPRRPRSMPAPKGCRSLVLDCRAFGGQAGASARIENYLGFPTGISGMALMGARLQPGAEVRRRDGDPATRCVPRLRDPAAAVRARAVQRGARRARARS